MEKYSFQTARIYIGGNQFYILVLYWTYIYVSHPHTTIYLIKESQVNLAGRHDEYFAQENNTENGIYHGNQTVWQQKIDRDFIINVDTHWSNIKYFNLSKQSNIVVYIVWSFINVAIISKHDGKYRIYF